MSNYSDIFGGIKNKLEANVTNLKVMEHPPESVNHFPAVLITPEPMDPTIAFGGNSFEADFRLTVLVSSADSPSGWTQLFDMIDPTTANRSIIKALKDNKTLNGKVDDSMVSMVENIGRRQWFGGGFYFGFDVVLKVVKSVA